MDVKWWPKVDTTFSKKELKKLGKEIISAPKEFNIGSQASKIFADRREMNQEKIPLNWGYAEIMAYATLLKDGYPIRLTGQDRTFCL